MKGKRGKFFLVLICQLALIFLWSVCLRHALAFHDDMVAQREPNSDSQSDLNFSTSLIVLYLFSGNLSSLLLWLGYRRQVTALFVLAGCMGVFAIGNLVLRPEETGAFFSPEWPYVCLEGICVLCCGIAAPVYIAKRQRWVAEGWLDAVRRLP